MHVSQPNDVQQPLQILLGPALNRRVTSHHLQTDYFRVLYCGLGIAQTLTRAKPPTGGQKHFLSNTAAKLRPHSSTRCNLGLLPWPVKLFFTVEVVALFRLLYWCLACSNIRWNFQTRATRDKWGKKTVSRVPRLRTQLWNLATHSLVIWESSKVFVFASHAAVMPSSRSLFIFLQGLVYFHDGFDSATLRYMQFSWTLQAGWPLDSSSVKWE